MDNHFPIKPLGGPDVLKLFGIDPEANPDLVKQLDQIDKDFETVTDDEKRFRELLLSTEREGAEDLLHKLKMERFFTAPASVSYHDNEKGGLVRHSLKVYDEALRIQEELSRKDPAWKDDITLSPNSILISALLHDVAKCDEYDVDVNGKAVHREHRLPLDGHGTKSVIYILKWGFRLIDTEILAIRWHMGGKRIKDTKQKALYDRAKGIKLCNLIIRADYAATH